MQALITLTAFLLTLGVLVSFHEFGHFLAARCCGVRVLRFAVGFGKPLFTYRTKNQTEWVLAAIPLGGYVKLLDGRDREQVITPQERASAFDSKKLWQRSLIVAAGPFANFFLSVILFAIIYVSGVPQLPAVLEAPPETSLAAKLGLMQGDRVVGWQDLSDDELVSASGDFETVRSWNSLRWNLLDSLTAQSGFALELQGPSGGRFIKAFPAQDLPKISPNTDPMLALGIRPIVSPGTKWQELQLGPLDAVLYASHRVWLITKVSVRLMAGFFTGNTSLKQLGGPLSIADMAGKSVQVGWQAFFAFLALISISIGLLNLLPFPMLDGGQLLYDAWELVAGKRISISMQEQFQKLGFLLLISLSLLALFNDLQRYFSP
ncbi:RIP metalloprotease [Polynucleobacter sp. AP-Melu-500A-A1]|uniref:M50 family metallopeptidase n=1 Tax=Polynucleobacter sp. AP-Melu-500A-A1 TaxID=2576929 RepID=UPI001C0C79C4|nr:site-2 protease family protein [Polynucleobacter sp. AP-Melu-500A-A1]MBU3630962.1 site-2 protease family protein [Polynucleobacter sp. AP-Melu-500A-A1]